jgi:hypothetical protein
MRVNDRSPGENSENHSSAMCNVPYRKNVHHSRSDAEKEPDYEELNRLLIDGVTEALIVSGEHPQETEQAIPNA